MQNIPEGEMRDDAEFRWKLIFGFIQVALTMAIAGGTVYYAYAYRLQGRPWVVLDQLGFDDTVEHAIKASIKNVGGGPAFSVELIWECELSLSPRDGRDSKFIAAAERAIARARDRPLLWPSIGQSDSRASFMLKGDDVTRFLGEDDQHGIYCFGTITYRAADQSAHETGFVMEYTTKAQKLRARIKTELGETLSGISSSFDASDFKDIGGERLNYAN